MIERPLPTAPYPGPPPGAARRRPGPALAVLFRIVLLGLPLAALLGAAYGTGYAFAPAPRGTAARAFSLELPRDEPGKRRLIATLRARKRQLEAALAREKPKGVYIVVDQTQNRLYLMRDETILLKAVCSAGSGYILKESVGGRRQWVFDTPRGVFRVTNKIENPVWKKPDWAFVEEGKPIPKNPAERFEYGVLGEYALYLEDGYLIHGTLYERLLGRPVTHGCIRLGREDLRTVWKTAPTGTPVYIF